MAHTAAETGHSFDIPVSMKAIRYNKPKDFALVTLPVPQPRPNEILVKGIVTHSPNASSSLIQVPVKSCGICGSDLHIHSGDLDTRMPVITGHETSGLVVKMGSRVKGFEIGDKVTADNAELCGYCQHCRQGKPLYCENFATHGLHRK